MKYLLDTHVFLWWLNSDRKLGDSVKRIIADPDNSIYVSVISGWEISIKTRAKKLQLKISLRRIFENFQFNLLGVNLEHILELHKLPLYHKDPFDRILVVQSRVEGLTLITNDLKLSRYKIRVIG